MVGIQSCGVYIPFNRLERKRICEAFSKKGDRGEKAVASYDEDSITMAVAAAASCCGLTESPAVKGVYMASTTLPYKEKQCSTVVAAALDVGADVRTADFASSLRCGSTAMLAAFDEAAKGNDVLVTASDRRTAFADGANELLFGDGAAAFVVGSDNLIAELKGSLTISRDFYDLWRAEGEPFVKSWEDRFAITQQYMPVMKQAAAKILEQCGLEAKDMDKVVIYAHTARYQGDLARALGFTADQLQDSLYEVIGNTGCAAGPLMLCAALENSKPGDKILYLGYGEGCDAMIFETTEAVANLPKRVKDGIEHKRTTMPYEKYLRWRGLLTTEPQRRPPLRRMSLPEYYRVPGKNFALYGTRCKVCGAVQYPGARICIECHSVDQSEPYRFLGKKGVIATYTIDKITVSEDPPSMIAVIDFEGGGRIFTNIVDCEPEEIAIGKEVEMSFRCIQAVDGIRTYYWKSVLKREKGGN